MSTVGDVGPHLHDHKNGLASDPVGDNHTPSLGAIMKFMADSMEMNVVAGSSSSDPKSCISNEQEAIEVRNVVTFPPKLKKGFTSMQHMIVAEFGEDAFRKNSRKLTEAFELMYTSEADGVIERSDGFDIWFNTTRNAKNIARSAVAFLESIKAVFKCWQNDLNMLHENPNFKSLRLDGDHDAATGAKSRESSVEKTGNSGSRLAACGQTQHFLKLCKMPSEA